MKASDALKIAGQIPTWLEDAERLVLYELAQKVNSGTIAEVGCLYGGSTALLGIGCPTAEIHIFDDFSWSPLETMRAGPETLRANLKAAGIKNTIHLHQGDSRETAKGWDQPISLLWVDGGHSYEYVYSDLEKLGKHAQVIACHDYNNPSWMSVNQAVDMFLREHREFYLDSVTRTLAVLRRVA